MFTMGNKYPVFIVVSAPNCCQECADAYVGKVFITEEDKDKLPPLHNECNCIAMYFNTITDGKCATGIAEDVRQTNKDATQKTVQILKSLIDEKSLINE